MKPLLAVVVVVVHVMAFNISQEMGLEHGDPPQRNVILRSGTGQQRSWRTSQDNALSQDELQGSY